MKKVIKHGDTHFKTTCPYCGCEFEYDVEDLERSSCITSTSLNYEYRIVKCPDCGAECYHTGASFPHYPEVIYTYTSATTNDWPDCDKCPNKPDFSKGPLVGDTPCTWCRKNTPTCN